MPPLRRRDAFARLWNGVLDATRGRRAQVLLGARQVGKSTLVRQVVDAALDGEHWSPRSVLYLDFSSDLFAVPPSVREVLDAWEISAAPRQRRLIVLDELSQAPNWARGLKALVDATRSGAADDTVLATDSSASLLRAGAAEHLEGRVDEQLLTGLTYGEFLNLTRREDEDATAHRMSSNALERYLSLGGYPEHRHEGDPARARERIRADVVDKAILRDVGREGVDVERVRRLYVHLVRASGALFTASDRAREIAAQGESAPDARSVQEWVRLLEQASLLASLSPWAPAEKRMRSTTTLSARPKLYAADHGMIAAFDPAPDPRRRPEVEDRILETAVFTHLRSLRLWRRDFALGYLRREARGEEGEIDFVAQFASRCVAIEVTSSRKLMRKARKMVPLARDVAADRSVLVYRGPTRDETPEGQAVNLEDFLLEPAVFLGEDR